MSFVTRVYRDFFTDVLFFSRDFIIDVALYAPLTRTIFFVSKLNCPLKKWISPLLSVQFNLNFVTAENATTPFQNNFAWCWGQDNGLKLNVSVLRNFDWVNDRSVDDQVFFALDVLLSQHLVFFIVDSLQNNYLEFCFGIVYFKSMKIIIVSSIKPNQYLSKLLEVDNNLQLFIQLIFISKIFVFINKAQTRP